MQYALTLFGVFAWLGLMPNLAPAHFNILLPDKPSAKKGETVTFTYQWGHPFEHQLFDAPAPAEVEFSGGQLGAPRFLTSTPGVVGAGEKKVRIYHFRYTPEYRRDYVFVLRTPPIWMEEEQVFFQDTVKVVLHVQAQRGWDDALGGFEMIPLTRPYGLLPGMAFQAQAQFDKKPLVAALVEVERYNPTPPKALPPDEHITRAAKTDPNGVVTCTLPESGWWCLTAQRDGGKKARAGKDYLLRQRTTLWVFVDDKLMSK